MALVLADRVLETTTTAGSGTITLAGAKPGYQSFSAIGDGNTTYYTIALQGGSEWEVGIGTYTASGTTLSRDTVLSSSAGGAKVTFSAGTKDVFCDYPAGRAVYGNAAGTVVIADLNATSATITTLSGTNFSATSLTLTNALAVTQGGTGQTSFTDGQLLIGNSTGNTLTKSTLTAGTGISITNGTGSITISAAGGLNVGAQAYAWFIS